MLLKLIKKIDEATDTKSFYFEPDVMFSWEAGQYLYLTLEKITKQFTIASSPTEKLIQITTRIRKESEFKQKLDNLKIGDEIEARAPFGTFVLDKNITSNIFLAGGIGITPFRSMIKHNIDKNLKIPMHLVCSNSDSEFVFKNELDKWQKENDFIKVTYHDSSISGHLKSSKLFSLLSTYYILHTTYYAVGPPPFVNAIEDILEKLKIPPENIRTEKFIGY
jgi:ferredoxin-NADP reductase